MTNYKNDCTDCTNKFVNDLKEFNRTCLNFGYIQGTLEAVSTDRHTDDVCRQMFSDCLDFMFDTFCRLHNIGESKDESKDETKDETKDKTKEGIEDNVEKFEGMYTDEYTDEGAFNNENGR